MDKIVLLSRIPILFVALILGVVCSAVMLLVVERGVEAQSAGSSRASVSILAPRKAEVGVPIQITVSLKGAQDVGGYETNLLYKKGSAEFGSVSGHVRSVARNGYAGEALGPVESDLGVSFGAFTCTAGSSGNCIEVKQSRGAGKGISGARKLATITVVPTTVGKLQFRLSGTRLASATGETIASRTGSPTIVVQVGNSPRLLKAPSGVPWNLGGGSERAEGLDITGDGKVAYADNMESAVSWLRLRQDGRACYPPSTSSEEQTGDVNGNGCVDIGDVQKVATSYGSRSSASSFSSSEQADGQLPGNFVVNSALDTTNTVNASDSTPGDGICSTSDGVCTLRAAIEESNAHTGSDQISFNIPGAANGVRNIRISKDLPVISDTTGATTIDGYTQPGATPNTSETISNAVVKVQITSNPTFAYYGFTITSPNNVIRGLSISRMFDPVYLYGFAATGNVVSGNLLGTDATGMFSAGQLVDKGSAVVLQNGASQNSIGIATPAGRNVISGNARHGVAFYGNADYNTVMNNIVGLSPDGARKLANIKHGIDLNGGASQNIIGGTGSYERNVISGNAEEGVELSHEYSTTENEVVGNYFGTDVTGESSPSYTKNGLTPVQVEDRPTNNVIRENVIGGSNLNGILFTQAGRGNVVKNNHIGVSPRGNPIPNTIGGIQISGLPRDPTTTPSTGQIIGPGNYIAYNGSRGIRVFDNGNNFNTITRNSIHDNVPLGIDLAPLGVTLNDPDDVDAGPNGNQNYPNISVASTQRVTGTSCAGCTVEVFISDRSSASGNAQGKTFVGSGIADSDDRFSVRVSGVAEGQYVTTTATNPAGSTSEFSGKQIVVNGDAPSPPSGFSATGQQNKIDLDWSDNGEQDLAGYSVYRSTTLGGPYQKVSSGDLLTRSSFSDTSLTAGTTYFYVVTASDNAANESDYSQEVSATSTPDNIAPETPRNLTAGYADGRVILDWDDNMEEDLVGYSIYRSQTAGGPHVEISSGWISDSSFFDTEVSVGNTYHYVVTATDNAGNTSSNSLEASIIIRDEVPPGTPQNLSVSEIGNSVKLDWNANIEQDLSGYRVFRSRTAGGPYDEISSGTTQSNSYTDENTSVGATYYYVVRAVDANGNASDYSGEVSITRDLPDTPPERPLDLTAISNARNVDLDWSDNGEQDLAGYSVYRSTTLGGPYQKISSGDLLTRSSFSDTSLTAGTTYFYVVTASDNAANESDYSQEVSATPAKSALSFDGLNDFVNIPDSALNTSLSQNRTYEVSIRTSDNVTSRQFIYESGGTANGTSIEIQGGKLYFNSWGEGWRVVSASAPVEANTSYQIAATYSKATGIVELYLDGVKVASASRAAAIKYSADNIALGGIDGWTRDHTYTSLRANGFFKGRINGFRAWSTIRTRDQIISDAQSGPSGSEPALLTFYKFDEGSGTVLRDSSSKNVNGTINGASWFP